MKFSKKTLFIVVVIIVLAAVVILQATTDFQVTKLFQKGGDGNEEQAGGDEAAKLVEGAPCEGDPIKVDYTYPHPEDEDFENPWECQVQCTDGIQRYISYSNGKGTQCEKLPGCLDQGEDQAVTCKPSDEE